MGHNQYPRCTLSAWNRFKQHFVVSAACCVDQWWHAGSYFSQKSSVWRFPSWSLKKFGDAWCWDANVLAILESKQSFYPIIGQTEKKTHLTFTFLKRHVTVRLVRKKDTCLEMLKWTVFMSRVWSTVCRLVNLSGAMFWHRQVKLRANRLFIGIHPPFWRVGLVDWFVWINALYA